jgi:predicted dehydrogenase
MKKIGLVGAGQAGQRIAVALSHFGDVSLTGIVDPKNGRQTLGSPDSKWFAKKAKFFSEDNEMMAQGYDAVVIAADPINVIHPLIQHPKMRMLAENRVTCPILWERPMGFLPEHPDQILRTVPSKAQSVVSFARYGLPTKVVRGLIDSDSLGEVTDFDVFVTLNCGLSTKSWRQSGEMSTPQPVHLLDNAFEQIESMGIGLIEQVEARSRTATRNGTTFDEKWEISVHLDSGITGRVVGLQYVGQREFLYPLRSVRITGTSGALVSTLGMTRLIDISGREHSISLASYGVDPRIVPATAALEQFFREVDGYPTSTPCRGEAQALAECLRTWVDSIGSRKKLATFNLAMPSDSSRFLAIAAAAVESSNKSKCVKIAEFLKQ